MKRVVVVVCLVVLAIALAVLVLRPGGRDTGDPARPGGWAETLGRLVPDSSVRAEDIAGLPCWDAAGGLRVPAGSACATRLPDERTRLELCVESGPAGLEVRVRGERFGSQRVSLAACGGGEASVVDLYDKGMVLGVACPPLGPPCVLRLG